MTNPKTKRAFPTIFSTGLALLLGTMSVCAKTYYVSQSTGNDNLNGLAQEPGNNAGPWKTLAKASISLAPGDQILLKCGDTWNEELAPKGEGTPQNPILISSYGKGAKPIIDREQEIQDRTGISLVDQGGF